MKKWYIIVSIIIVLLFIPAWQRGGTCDGISSVCPLKCDTVAVWDYLNVDSLKADVTFFRYTTIDNATDGHAVFVYRNAAEGLNYLKFYVGSDKQAYIVSNTWLNLKPSAGGINLFSQDDIVNKLDRDGDDFLVRGDENQDIFKINETTEEVKVFNYFTLDPSPQPGAPQIGSMYYDSVGSKDTIWVYDGAAWSEMWHQP